MTDEITAKQNEDGSYGPIVVKVDSPTRLVLQRAGVVCVRMGEFLFDNDKAFILPGALVGIAELVTIYEELGSAEAVVVGHTDALGQIAANDELSLTRAEMVAAYLQDQSEVWLAMYETKVRKSARWGSREDGLMLAQAGFAGDPRGYQKERGLDVDGDIGPLTRGALIEDYMAADGTSLPPDLKLHVHGASEHFPAVETADGVAEPKNRRVELFFFDRVADPVAPQSRLGAQSPEYPRWLQAVTREVDIQSEPTPKLEFTSSIHIALRTRSGAAALANRECTVHGPDGPIQLTSNEEGVIVVPEIDPGDYLLEVEHDTGTAKIVIAAVRHGEGPFALAVDEAGEGTAS